VIYPQGFHPLSTISRFDHKLEWQSGWPAEVGFAKSNLPPSLDVDQASLIDDTLRLWSTTLQAVNRSRGGLGSIALDEFG
jgi:hypothetical protein